MMSPRQSRGTRRSAAAQATLVHEGLHGPNYAVLYRDTVSIHLVRAAEAQHGIKPPVQAQFWVDEGFEEIFENAKRRGVRILEPIEERPWGTGIFSWLIRTAMSCG